MIFAKANIPVRLFFLMPDYSTDKGVQAEIRSEGTSSGGSALLQTVNLTHNTAGLYEAFYTPPDGYERLMVNYIIYTSTGYTDKFIGYAPASEQLVINSGVGQLGGGSVVRPLSEQDYEKLADMVWRVKLTKIIDKDSAAMWVKSIQPYDDSGIKDTLSELKKQMIGLETNIKNIPVSDNKKLVEKIDKIQKEIVDRHTQLGESVDNFSSLLLGSEAKTSALSSEVKELLKSSYTENAKEIKKILDTIGTIVQEVKTSSNGLSAENAKLLQTFFTKIIDTNLSIYNKATQEIYSKIIAMLSDNLEKNLDEFDEIKDMINDL